MTTQTEEIANVVEAEKFNRLMRIPKGVLSIAQIVNKDSAGAFGAVRVRRSLDGNMKVDATDGRRAIVVTWEDEFLLPTDEHTTCVPAGLALMAEKAIPSKGTPDELMVEMSASDAHRDFEAKVRQGEDSVTIAGAGVVAAFPAIDDVIPDYRLTSAKDGTCARTTLGIDLLIGLLKAMKATGVDQVDVDVPTKPGRVVKLTGQVWDTPRKVVAIQCPLNTEARGEQPKDEPAPHLPGMEPPAHAVTPESVAAGVEASSLKEAFPDYDAKVTGTPDNVTVTMTPKGESNSIGSPLVWEADGESWQAENTVGLKNTRGNVLCFFVDPSETGEFTIKDSASDLLPANFNAAARVFETVDEAKAFCAQRNRDLTQDGGAS